MRRVLYIMTASAFSALVFAPTGAEAQVNNEAAAVAYFGESVPPERCQATLLRTEYNEQSVGGDYANADLNGCRIRVGENYSELSPYQKCIVDIHEYGHLLGIEHKYDSRDRLGLMITSNSHVYMFFNLSEPVKECSFLIPSPPASVGQPDPQVAITQDSMRREMEWLARKAAVDKLRLQRRRCLIKVQDEMKHRGRRLQQRQRARCRSAYNAKIHGVVSVAPEPHTHTSAHSHR